MEVTDTDKTETNKALVKEYFETVVLGGRGDQIAKYRSMITSTSITAREKTTSPAGK